MNGRLHAIHRSPGGVPKLPVPEAQVTPAGVAGDVQRNLKHHGGPDRAVCIYSLERIEALVAEGHPIAPGTIGENLTVAGVDWDTVLPGTRFRVGESLHLEVTTFAVPCSNIAGSFAAGEIRRVLQSAHPGWSRAYARVLAAGTVRVGDSVSIEAP